MVQDRLIPTVSDVCRCGGQVRLVKINTTQQIVCVQFPCIIVNNDLHTRIYPRTIRSYHFLQGSLKILNLKRNLAKESKKHTNDRRPSNEHGVGNCAQCILSSALKTMSKFNESYRRVGEFCCNMDTNACGV